MRTIRILLVACLVVIGTRAQAESSRNFTNEDAVSVEIERLLDQNCQDEKEDLSVTVFFSISEDKKIQNLNVASANNDVNELLTMSLQHQELSGNSWKLGKIYEIKVTRRKG